MEKTVRETIKETIFNHLKNNGIIVIMPVKNNKSEIFKSLVIRKLSPFIDK